MHNAIASIYFVQQKRKLLGSASTLLEAESIEMGMPLNADDELLIQASDPEIRQPRMSHAIAAHLSPIRYHAVTAMNSGRG